MEANHGEVRDDNWPLVVDSQNRLSPSFTMTQHGPFAHPVPAFTDESTPCNLVADPKEPCDQPVPFHDTLLSSFTIPPQQRVEPLDPHFLTSFETNRAANRTENTQTQHQLTESSVHLRPHTSMSIFPFEETPKLPRYYSKALSVDDRQALLQGEKNHNLQEWSAKNLVSHHDARKDLVPRKIPEVEKTKALAVIEHDEQHSQGALSRITGKVRKIFNLPRNKITIDTVKDDEHGHAQLRQASQSTYDLHSSISPPHGLPPLPQLTPTPTPPFEEAEEEPRHYRSSHARAASSGDYFSQSRGPRTSAHNTRISQLASTSGPPSSNSSIRVRSPLAQEVQFRANPLITFDSFLAPHKSGKGEVFHDSENARKIKTPKASPSPSPKTKAKTRKLTKMPSMPLLRKCSSGS
jgi:hypothetical protein